MTRTTVNRFLATVLCSTPVFAFSAPIDLTCKWTDPKNPGLTKTLTMTVDSVSSNLRVSRGPTNSVVFSAAEIRFNVHDSRAQDWKYVFNRTTLILSETNHTRSHPTDDYECLKVDPKV